MKVSETKLSLWVAMGAICIIAACARTSHPVSHVSVKPPFQHVDVVPDSYQIDAVKGGEIKTENGTHIIVPANAFVDAKGNIITDKVEIKYREFHNTAQIMASGIPMTYDSAGQTINFQSAGMFEIKGSCKNEPVSIAPDKKITVEMASYQDGSQYNFYKYDNSGNNWSLQGHAIPTANIEKQEAQAKLDVEKDKIVVPKVVNPHKFVMDLDVDYTLYPELKAFNGILWQYAGDDPKKDPKNHEKELSASIWTNIKLKPNPDKAQTYLLALDCGNKHYSMVVEPVLSGKDLAKAKKKFEAEMSNYASTQENIAMQQRRLKNEANLLRTYQVSNFGIYNWDCALRQPDVVMAPATFTFDQKINADNVTVYLISGEAHKLVCYYPGQSKNFSFNPNIRNCLVAVMPNDRLAIFSSEAFGKIKSWKAGDPIDFAFKTMDKPVKDVNDLGKILENI